MEDACEVLPQSDMVLPEKDNKKRKLKTPSQVEALERLYNEHKYPTESLKLQLAEEYGMTEKQVSGWFCHRRLKDKNMLKDEVLASGRQEFSSGIIQDRGNALKQDACSSTKQGEFKHSDVREVESGRYYGLDYPAADISYGSRSQYINTRNYTTVENASSDSSSASQGPPAKDPYDLKPLSFSSRSSYYNSVSVKAPDSRGYMMTSGYFHSQDEIENAAISAVKRQLGRHYKEDGPQLDVNFEALPPGAFDSLVGDANTEPYFGDDPIVQNSVSSSCARKQSTFDTDYTRYNRSCPQGSYPKGSLVKKFSCKSDLQNGHSNHGSGRKSFLSGYDNGFSDHISSMDGIIGIPTVEGSALNKSRKHGSLSKHKVDGTRSGSMANYQSHSFAGKVTTKDNDDSTSHLLQRGEYLNGRPSNLILPSSELLDSNGREYTRRMEKEEKLRKKRRNGKESLIPVRAKIQPKDELRRGKRMQGDESLTHGYASKTPSPQPLCPWESQVKGYTAEVPTSFSEDETAATTSTD